MLNRLQIALADRYRIEGEIGAARVGYTDGQYILNPTKTNLATSQLNLVVAGTEAAVLMVESEAKELPEDVMLGAVIGLQFAIAANRNSGVGVALLLLDHDRPGRPPQAVDPPRRRQRLRRLGHGQRTPDGQRQNGREHDAGPSHGPPTVDVGSQP